jgi:hypothetical protein
MRPLHRILGLGFGLALAFGSAVGVGILRLPGTLAGALGDSRLIVLFWVLGPRRLVCVARCCCGGGAGGDDPKTSHNLQSVHCANL